MYRFLNYPSKIDIEEYKKQSYSFLLDLKNIFKDKRFSLYNIGELGLPGVSDLDFLIITENLSYKLDILNIIKKYNLIDTIIFIEYKKINELEYLTHHYNFSYIGGEKIDEKFFIKNNKYLFLIYSWKILFFSGLRNFYIPYYKKKIYIKNMLNWINDLRYPVFYLSKLVQLDNEILKFINEIKIFRSAWFGHEDTYKLLCLLERSIQISWDLIFILSNIFAKEKLINKGKLTNKVNSCIYGRFLTIFADKNIFSEYRLYTEKYFTTISKSDRFLILPLFMNYENWNDELNVHLYKILTLNKGFIKFGFDKKYLNVLLFIKKTFDYIKIKIYKKIYKLN